MLAGWPLTAVRVRGRCAVGSRPSSGPARLGPVDGPMGGSDERREPAGAARGPTAANGQADDCSTGRAGRVGHRAEARDRALRAVRLLPFRPAAPPLGGLGQEKARAVVTWVSAGCGSRAFRVSPDACLSGRPVPRTWPRACATGPRAATPDPGYPETSSGASSRQQARPCSASAVTPGNSVGVSGRAREQCPGGAAHHRYRGGPALVGRASGRFPPTPRG